MRNYFFLILILFSSFSITAQKILITNLEVDKLNSPHGLDNKNPKFSWIIDTDHYNVLQTHYQVFVATDKVFSKNSLVWDSGKVASDESVYVNYLGKELAYDTQYFWTVKVWTNKSKRSSQSKVSSWKTGLMDKQNWKSNWITVNNEDMTSPKIPYFINDFRVDSKIISANLYITSRGVYEAHINGKRIGDAILTPGWTSYSNRIQYQAYDVMEMLLTGENRIGVMLADGWYRNCLCLELFG